MNQCEIKLPAGIIGFFDVHMEKVTGKVSGPGRPLAPIALAYAEAEGKKRGWGIEIDKGVGQATLINCEGKPMAQWSDPKPLFTKGDSDAWRVVYARLALEVLTRDGDGFYIHNVGGFPYDLEVRWTPTGFAYRKVGGHGKGGAR